MWKEVEPYITQLDTTNQYNGGYTECLALSICAGDILPEPICTNGKYRIMQRTHVYGRHHDRKGNGNGKIDYKQMNKWQFPRYSWISFDYFDEKNQCSIYRHK